MFSPFLPYFVILVLFNFLIVLWSKPEIRRQFFETYAANNGFNPLVAQNWYTQTREKIMSMKVFLNI